VTLPFALTPGGGTWHRIAVLDFRIRAATEPDTSSEIPWLSLFLAKYDASTSPPSFWPSSSESWRSPSTVRYRGGK
jgi:hypothetical protein